MISANGNVPQAHHAAVEASIRKLLAARLTHKVIHNGHAIMLTGDFNAAVRMARTWQGSHCAANLREVATEGEN